MKQITFKTIFSRIALAASALSLLLFASFSTVNAQTVTFAQFLSQSGGQDYLFTNNGTSGNFNAIGGGAPIDFKYLNIAGLPASLQGFQNAHLFVTTTTTTPGTLLAGTVTQPLNQTVTIQIIRDTPAPVGVGSGTRTVLLTAVFSPSANTPAIVGSNGGNSATMQATTPDHVVTFSSDFVGFGLTTNRNLSFSFSSVTPVFVLGSGSFLQSVSAAAAGTFASNPPPAYQIPSAAPVSVSGQVFTPAGRALRNATVSLTESNGTVHTARTGAFGYFNFSDIDSGQTVAVSVRSKQFYFAPSIVGLEDSVSGLNLVAEY